MRLKKHDKTKNSLVKCIFESFNDYFEYEDLNRFSIEMLIASLNKELNDQPSESKSQTSKFKDLIKKKSNKMGAVEFILKKISWYFEQGEYYDSSLDPIIVYNGIKAEECEKKTGIEQVSLDVLEKELTNLEENRKELCLQDTFILREELESVKRIYIYIQ